MTTLSLCYRPIGGGASGAHGSHGHRAEAGSSPHGSSWAETVPVLHHQVDPRMGLRTVPSAQLRGSSASRRADDRSGPFFGSLHTIDGESIPISTSLGEQFFSDETSPRRTRRNHPVGGFNAEDEDLSLLEEQELPLSEELTDVYSSEDAAFPASGVRAVLGGINGPTKNSAVQLSEEQDDLPFRGRSYSGLEVAQEVKRARAAAGAAPAAPAAPAPAAPPDAAGDPLHHDHPNVKQGHDMMQKLKLGLTKLNAKDLVKMGAAVASADRDSANSREKPTEIATEEEKKKVGWAGRGRFCGPGQREQSRKAHGDRHGGGEEEGRSYVGGRQRFVSDEEEKKQVGVAEISLGAGEEEGRKM